jgi:hypothetical protein
MLPSRLVTQAYAARGTRLWIATRALISVVFFFAKINPFDMSAGSSIEIVLVSVALCFLDTRRRREDVLLGNLGVTRPVLGVLFAIPAILGEIAIAIVVGMIA